MSVGSVVVVTALEAGGLEVTAIHNHLLSETLHVMYIHFGRIRTK